MNLIERNHCVLTGKLDLEHLYTLRDFPVFMGCTSQPNHADVKGDMNWWISRHTGLIQLNKLLPLDVLYPESHGAGCVGALWDKHHKAFAAFVNQLTPSAAFEIGGAHGILSKEYQKYGDIPWTILEPNPTPVENCKARFIKGFFDDNFSNDETFDVVIHSHVFEHIYEPDLFMRHLANFIPDGKHLAFSIPNMQIMLEKKYTNCINFEHTLFLTEPYIEYLLSKHGFRCLRREYFLEDHSIFYHAVRESTVSPLSLGSDLYSRNKNLYLDYVKYHEALIQELNSEIASSNLPVYLFGAHVFAQYLIAFGLDTSGIVSILDNDPAKQGKRLYGTSLFVNSPKILRDVQSPVVILKAAAYNDEIKNDILQSINAKARFI